MSVFAPHGLRCARERAQRYRLVLGVEQAVKLGAAGFYGFGKLGLGDALLLHDPHLAGDHALDGAHRHGPVAAFVLQEIVER
jgi:hypothetical protein